MCTRLTIQMHDREIVRHAAKHIYDNTDEVHTYPGDYICMFCVWTATTRTFRIDCVAGPPRKNCCFRLSSSGKATEVKLRPVAAVPSDAAITAPENSMSETAPEHKRRTVLTFPLRSVAAYRNDNLRLFHNQLTAECCRQHSLHQPVSGEAHSWPKTTGIPNSATSDRVNTFIFIRSSPACVLTYSEANLSDRPKLVLKPLAASGINKYAIISL